MGCWAAAHWGWCLWGSRREAPETSPSCHTSALQPEAAEKSQDFLNTIWTFKSVRLILPVPAGSVTISPVKSQPGSFQSTTGQKWHVVAFWVERHSRCCRSYFGRAKCTWAPTVNCKQQGGTVRELELPLYKHNVCGTVEGGGWGCWLQSTVLSTQQVFCSFWCKLLSHKRLFSNI